MGSSSPPSSSAPHLQVDAKVEDVELKPVVDTKPDLDESFVDLSDLEDIEKYRKYEADYTHRLMAKYFSKKTIYGGDIFEENLTIDGEVIKSSRWPFTRSYADPVNSFVDQGCSNSNSAVEPATAISNGKHLPKKNG